MSCGSTTCTPPHNHRLQQDAPAALHLPSPLGWLGLLVHWQARWRHCEELRDLDDRILRDVGLTREQVEREARRL